jgi:hypothetical protein
VNVVVFAEVHFRTKLAVENAQTGTPNDNGAGGRSEVFSDSLIKIVTRFSFQLDIVENSEANAATETAKVGAGLILTEIVGKDADLYMFTLLGRCEGHEPPREKEKKCETLHGSRSPCKIGFEKKTDGRKGLRFTNFDARRKGEFAGKGAD